MDNIDKEKKKSLKEILNLLYDNLEEPSINKFIKDIENINIKYPNIENNPSAKLFNANLDGVFGYTNCRTSNFSY